MALRFANIPVPQAAKEPKLADQGFEKPLVEASVPIVPARTIPRLAQRHGWLSTPRAATVPMGLCATLPAVPLAFLAQFRRALCHCAGCAALFGQFRRDSVPLCRLCRSAFSLTQNSCATKLHFFPESEKKTRIWAGFSFGTAAMQEEAVPLCQLCQFFKCFVDSL